jgi:DNA primase
VIYQGRSVDPIKVWSRYVEFPANMRQDPDDPFLPKVQCPNPSHDTLKHHFQINQHQPLVHCFAHCGISGTWKHAICVIEGLYEKFKVEEATSARESAQRRQRAWREANRIVLRSGGRGVSKPVRRTESSSRPVATVPPESLAYESYLPQAGLEYLESRGISSASVGAWRIGWHGQEKRLVIPAYDERGVLKFLIKRAVFANQHPKYLYTEGFPKTSLLFGAGQIDLGLVSSDGLILVEGSIDTVLNHQHRLRNTVGILGTGISEQQCRIIARISPPKIFLMFDRDSAGIRNIEIAAANLRKYPLYVMRYPKGKSDPAEMTEAEKHRQISRAIPVHHFFRHPNVTLRKEIYG